MKATLLNMISIAHTWNPVIVFGLPAWPTVSTACPTLSIEGRGRLISDQCVLGKDDTAKDSIFGWPA
jgi:hypothetical protein